MYEVLDHPDIRRAMATGYSRWTLEKTYVCSICGAELDADDRVYTVEINRQTYAVGCCNCIKERTAEGVYA